VHLELCRDSFPHPSQLVATSGMALRRSLSSLLVASGCATWAAGSDVPQMAAHLDFPPGVVLSRTTRFNESGSGVHLTFNDGSVDASFLGLSGDAYLVVSKGEAFCKIDVGLDPASAAMTVEVYEQQGLDCRVVSSTGGEEGSDGPEHYRLKMSADDTQGYASDCDSATDSACQTRWRSVSPQEPEWSAHIEFPEGVVLRKARRAGDLGYGVDRNMTGRIIDAGIWDDDGDAFFKASRGHAFCEIRVGSNGLGPGLEVEVYEQRGLDCQVVSSSGGPVSYALSMSADATRGHKVDCHSPAPGVSYPEAPCHSTWAAPSAVMV